MNSVSLESHGQLKHCSGKYFGKKERLKMKKIKTEIFNYLSKLASDSKF